MTGPGALVSRRSQRARRHRWQRAAGSDDPRVDECSRCGLVRMQGSSSRWRVRSPEDTRLREVDQLPACPAEVLP